MYTGLKKYIRYLHVYMVCKFKQISIIGICVCFRISFVILLCCKDICIFPLLSYSIADLRVDLVKDYFKQNILVI